jgi:adenylate cyclase
MGRESVNTEARLQQLEKIHRELLPVVLNLARQGEQMQELALAHDLEPVISDLESICKAIRDLKELSGALVRSDIADRLVAETDILKAQKTLRHDLRTPINAIKGYGEMLLEDLQDFQAEIIRPNLLRLLDDSTALSGRIYEIVDLGAVEPPEEPDKGTIVGSERVMVSISPISEAHKGPFSGRRALVPGKVLVVDDVEANRDILRERLTRQGHNVTATEDGISALRLLREEEFELVLLDVMMPGMDGFEVLARIKSDDNLRDVPVIMVSALDEMDSVIRWIELGAEDYLPKSFDPVLLRARVNACLEKKKWADRERTHVKRLAAAMKQVQDRDLSVTLDDSGEDVYAEVYRGFNLMTEELRDEAEILELAHDLSGEIEIEALIDKFVHSTSSLLDAERGVFYLYDQKTDELRARVVAQGRTQEIKLAADAGLVGAVF